MRDTIYTVGGERFVCPYWDLLPPLAESERAELLESVRKDGIQQPILLSPEPGPGGVLRVIDGYHRLTVAVELGLSRVPTRYATAAPVAGKPTAAARLSPGAERELALTLNLARRHLSAEQRRELVGKLRGQGMSTRAIAQAVGVSKDTVARDLSGVSFETRDTVQAHAPIVGRDGKTYAVKPKPAPPAPAIEDEEEEAPVTAPREERQATLPPREETTGDEDAEEAKEANEGLPEAAPEVELLEVCGGCRKRAVTVDVGGLSLCPSCSEIHARKAAPSAKPITKKEEAKPEGAAPDQTYNTPPWVVELVRVLGGGVIDLDPCSNATSVVGAARTFDEASDGLSQSWAPSRPGALIYVNPPFNDIEPWVRKCAESAQEGALVVALLPLRTFTKWYQEIVWPSATYKVELAQRVAFSLRGVPQPGYREPCALFVWGAVPHALLAPLHAVGRLTDLELQRKHAARAA